MYVGFPTESDFIKNMSENFDLETEEKNKGELSMSVSAICHTDEGEKYAFVSFTDGVRTAEGRIPECNIISNNGFAAIEITELEKYMKENLATLKKMASKINIFDAFMK